MAGEPLRQCHTLLRACSDDMTSAEFAQFLGSS
jgi:hypothetical protein